MLVRPATTTDQAAIHAVVEAAFGQPDEADLVDALRADGDALLELVAEDESGAVIGHLLYSPLATDTGAVFAALAPLAVAPGEQRTGLGTMLMEVGHALLAAQGVDAVIVLGHPDYYPRAGFSAAAAKTVKAPFSGEHFMALALTPGALDRPVAVTYAKAFGIPSP
ncbi:GNAT family N-acetyltransferase [Caulobacter mirabilis]|uniref:GNAT family N-acetyltransferase n=1 Tax=Caulobacter mirabilis TaxID=69666 RepID=A0A2D2AU65_9CAUL|nr:N-acetyltransferase [Caulobacter mirabilis]ATQ41549.1 GNAT family N-acetyltransferase [Caulobacter mirabilis]